MYDYTIPFHKLNERKARGTIYNDVRHSFSAAGLSTLVMSKQASIRETSLFESFLFNQRLIDYLKMIRIFK